MRPNKETVFKPISELVNYSNKYEWYCHAVVFSPETENEHFAGCPPYIALHDAKGMDDDAIYFEVPEIVAYYAKTHPCYTYKGIQNYIKQGEKKMADKIKSLLNI